MWNLKAEDRLHCWREFRTNIGTLPFDKAIADTIHLWSYAPFVNHHLDLSEPMDWPGPWELLTENKYDDMAKALGMLYTLCLSSHGSKHEFSIIKASASSGLENYNLVSIDDGKYILNYQFDKVISNEQLDRETNLIRLYTAEELQLSKYQ